MNPSLESKNHNYCIAFKIVTEMRGYKRAISEPVVSMPGWVAIGVCVIIAILYKSIRPETAITEQRLSL